MLLKNVHPYSNHFCFISIFLSCVGKLYDGLYFAFKVYLCKLCTLEWLFSDRSLNRNFVSLLCTRHFFSVVAAFLQSRSWQGLEQKLGETPVSEVVEGRTGLATSYTHEREHNLN